MTLIADNPLIASNTMLDKQWYD